MCSGCRLLPWLVGQRVCSAVFTDEMSSSQDRAPPSATRVGGGDLVLRRDTSGARRLLTANEIAGWKRSQFAVQQVSGPGW